MDDPLAALTAITAVACGLNGGVFFAFSTFVMPAMRRLPAAQGTAAMQSINVTAVTPTFMSALFGTALACIAVVAAGISTWGESHAPYVVAAGAIYLAGTIGVTLAYHVPRNDALAEVDPATATDTSYWDRYLAEWTRWNHARAAAALVAALLLTIALAVD
jgi:uncharacterized membrane protein